MVVLLLELNPDPEGAHPDSNWHGLYNFYRGTFDTDFNRHNMYDTRQGIMSYTLYPYIFTGGI